MVLTGRRSEPLATHGFLEVRKPRRRHPCSVQFRPRETLPLGQQDRLGGGGAPPSVIVLVSKILLHNSWPPVPIGLSWHRPWAGVPPGGPRDADAPGCAAAPKPDECAKPPSGVGPRRPTSVPKPPRDHTKSAASEPCARSAKTTETHPIRSGRFGRWVRRVLRAAGGGGGATARCRWTSQGSKAKHSATNTSWICEQIGRSAN